MIEGSLIALVILVGAYIWIAKRPNDQNSYIGIKPPSGAFIVKPQITPPSEGRPQKQKPRPPRGYVIREGDDYPTRKIYLTEEDDTPPPPPKTPSSKDRLRPRLGE